ncbi:MAG: prolyl aminopeptidase [Robiginitomaculum sp.]|nr:MAG: prolyl aminopeptidase [Robiginitomaculum sp.]
MLNALFPPIAPYHVFSFEVSSLHTLYVEECGNPNGLPVIFLHGGPAAGCSEADRQFFDPEKYRIILFDQRGAGRSTPLASIEDNTTNDLIKDVEALREHLGIDKWVVFGGSWGSTFSLLYAQAHPDRALALILRGIFLSTKAELHHLFQNGMHKLFPEEYETYRDYIAPEKRGDLLAAYCELVQSDDEAIRTEAAFNFVNWEANGMTMPPQSGLVDINVATDIANGIIECYYLANQCFIAEGQILENIDTIKHIPIYIVHGRFDSICTPSSAWALHKAHGNSVLNITKDAAHASREPSTASVLVDYTNTVANKLGY